MARRPTKPCSAPPRETLSSPGLLPLVAAFVAVVDAGGFTAAARRTGLDKTLISRRVRALEEALERQLVNRTTRQIHITEAGRALYDRVSGPLGDVFGALEHSAKSDRIRGTVRVATAPALAAEIWGPILAKLAQNHPELQVEVRATETLVNLVEQGFDLAVRMGRLPDSTLVARKLASWRHVLCAAPAWIERHPEVRSPADLVDHWVLYTDVPMAASWRFSRGEDGVEIRVAARHRTDNGQMLLAMLRQGMGVSAIAPFQLEKAFAEGELVRCLPAWRVDHDHGLYAVVPHATYTPARVEVVRQSVAERVRSLEARWRELSD